MSVNLQSKFEASLDDYLSFAFHREVIDYSLLYKRVKLNKSIIEYEALKLDTGNPIFLLKMNNFKIGSIYITDNDEVVFTKYDGFFFNRQSNYAIQEYQIAVLNDCLKQVAYSPENIIRLSQIGVDLPKETNFSLCDYINLFIEKNFMMTSDQLDDLHLEFSNVITDYYWNFDIRNTKSLDYCGGEIAMKFTRSGVTCELASFYPRMYVVKTISKFLHAKNKSLQLF